MPGYHGPTVEAWKKERTDVPSAEEARALLADELAYLESVPTMEVMVRDYSMNLVPLADVRPDLTSAWTNEAVRIAIEEGSYYFMGKQGETVEIELRPYGGHNLDGRKWSLEAIDRIRRITCEGVRNQYSLTGVPPYLAMHPAELLVPKECIQGFAGQ